MRTITIFLLIFCYSCTTVSQQACLSTSTVLSQLDHDFKNELKRIYKINGEPQSEHYKKYLEGILLESVPREFFTDSLKTAKAKSFMESPSFKLVWSKYSEIKEQRNLKPDFVEVEPPRTASDNAPVKKKDFYAFDPNTEFFNCLIDNMADSQSKNLLEEVQKIPFMSPGIIVQGLIELNEFDDAYLQVYIGFQFYYDYIFMMNGLNRIE